MNVVNLYGRISIEPKVKYSQNGNLAIAEFSVACKRTTKAKGADYVPCVAFGKIAELAEKYLCKGSRVTITGSWRSESVKGNDGKSHVYHKCVVNSVGFVDTKQESDELMAGIGDGGTPGTPYVPEESKKSEDFINMDSYMDELPFT